MKNILLSFVALVFTLSAPAQIPNLLDQIRRIKGVMNLETYNANTDSIYFEFIFQQKLGKKFDTKQSDPSPFYTRVVTVINNLDAPTVFYVSGYNLTPTASDLGNNFRSYEKTCSDIFSLYPDANFVSMEHRYFGPQKIDPKTGYYVAEHRKSSYPVNFYNNLDYLTLENAAADFHNIIGGIKKILKGKTIMTGRSKGGISTAMQAYFYSEDVDIFMPYAAPFCNSLADNRMYDWITDSVASGTSQMREKVNACIDELMKKDASTNYVYSEYKRIGTEWYKNQDDYKGLSDDDIDGLVQMDYEQAVYAGILWNLWTYSDREAINNILDVESIGNSNESSELLLYSLWTQNVQQGVKDGWKEEAIGNPHSTYVRHFKPITEEEWYKLDTDGTAAYYYQSHVELGNYYIPFKEKFPSSISAERNANPYWMDSVYNVFDGKYSHQAYDDLFESIKNTESNILFIYGGDDPWTGARIEDQYIAKDNVNSYILPSQSHNAQILNAPEDIKNDIYQKVIFPVLGVPAHVEMAKAPTRKANDATYNLAGQRVGGEYKGIVISKGKKLLW